MTYATDRHVPFTTWLAREVGYDPDGGDRTLLIAYTDALEDVVSMIDALTLQNDPTTPDAELPYDQRLSAADVMGGLFELGFGYHHGMTRTRHATRDVIGDA